VPALGALGLLLGLFELCAVAAALAPITSEAERRSVRPNIICSPFFCFYRHGAGAKLTSG
jgi:hypothetical protein